MHRLRELGKPSDCSWFQEEEEIQDVVRLNPYYEALFRWPEQKEKIAKSNAVGKYIAPFNYYSSGGWQSVLIWIRVRLSQSRLNEPPAKESKLIVLEDLIQHKMNKVYRFPSPLLADANQIKQRDRRRFK